MNVFDCTKCKKLTNCGKCPFQKYWNEVRKHMKIKRFPRYPRFPRFVSRKERTSEGTLKCICGKRQQWYCGKFRRGICSDECFNILEGLWLAVQSFGS